MFFPPSLACPAAAPCAPMHLPLPCTFHPAGGAVKAPPAHGLPRCRAVLTVPSSLTPLLPHTIMQHCAFSLSLLGAAESVFIDLSQRACWHVNCPCPLLPSISVCRCLACNVRSLRLLPRLSPSPSSLTGLLSNPQAPCALIHPARPGAQHSAGVWVAAAAWVARGIVRQPCAGVAMGSSSGVHVRSR